MSSGDRPRLLGKLLAHRRDFGLRATLRLVAENLAHALSPDLARRLRRWDVHRQNVAFDRRYGTRTAGTTEPDVPDGGLRYEPTDEASFAWMMRALDLEWPRFTFVDLGSGKGKAALLAARLPFRRVIGVEYDDALCETVRGNLAAFARREQGLADVQFVTADATKWPFPDGDLLLYLFNPFSPRLVRVVLDNARRALLDAPREVVVAYYNVVDEALFEADWLRPLVPSRALPVGAFQAWRLVRTPNAADDSIEGGI